MTPGKGSKYREFYDLSGRITCMGRPVPLVPIALLNLPMVPLAAEKMCRVLWSPLMPFVKLPMVPLEEP